MQSNQFFTNENILASLGYPSSIMPHSRHVHYSSNEEQEELRQVAKRIEEQNNQWLEEKNNGTKS